MRHLVDGRKFGMNTSHRKAMFRTMSKNLIEHEQIKTTVAKAKELRRVVDRLITLGKDGTLASKRLAFSRVRDRKAVVKLFGPLAERFAKRSGGYTRVLRMDGTRWGDAAELAIIELVDRPIVEKRKKTTKPSKKDVAAEASAAASK
jgi:large subunit ribosomal protein L17